MLDTTQEHIYLNKLGEYVNRLENEIIYKKNVSIKVLSYHMYITNKVISNVLQQHDFRPPWIQPTSQQKTIFNIIENMKGEISYYLCEKGYKNIMWRSFDVALDNLVKYLKGDLL